MWDVATGANATFASGSHNRGNVESLRKLQWDEQPAIRVGSPRVAPEAVPRVDDNVRILQKTPNISPSVCVEASAPRR